MKGRIRPTIIGIPRMIDVHLAIRTSGSKP
jgi:hypothetical protein